jgi:23S rRNA pseudouridine1911/1915/1917 synthase
VTASRLTVEPSAAGVRLDRWLAETVPGLSRARVQDAIAAGRVTVDGVVRKPAHRLQGGERVDVDVPPPPPEEIVPEPIALAILHEDADVLVVDKPAGMVVHPGAGNATGTLAAAALAHAPSIAGVGGPRRPGVVHRLDKGTSGVLVIAKTQAAYESLTRQLSAHTMRRRYVAVVHGRVVRAEGLVDAPIGRDPLRRKRMAIRPAGQGKRAVTRYRVLERFPMHTYLEARLETGRTHQIRVHLASLGHPIVGDDVYGRGRPRPPVPLEGVALHASDLAFTHPITGEQVQFSAALPPRIGRLLSHLRNAG